MTAHLPSPTHRHPLIRATETEHSRCLSAECTGDICQYGHLDIHQEIVKEGALL